MKTANKLRVISCSNRPEWTFSRMVFALFLGLTCAASIEAQEQAVDEESGGSGNQQTIDSAEEDLRAEQERVRAAEISRELDLHLQAIDEMQGSQGVYSPLLQEAYGDLAAFFVEIEDFESAVRVYTDALQISRINTGLYSDKQLPIIHSLIESNSALRNWQATDDLYELRYHISSRVYDLGDSAYLEAAENYGAWKLRLLRENLLDLGYSTYSRNAEELSDFYVKLLENIGHQEGIKQKELIGVIQNKSETDLILARALASTPYTAFEGTTSRYVNKQRCRNVRNSEGQAVSQCTTVRVENPRYRESQRDAKQFALRRRARQVQLSIDRLREILDVSTDLNRVERDSLEAQIAELETQAYQLFRQSRSRRLF